MFIKVLRSNIVADDQGYMIIADPNGIMLTLRTPQKCIRRWMTTSELYFLSQKCERDFTNEVIIEELKQLHDQFFEEV